MTCSKITKLLVYICIFAILVNIQIQSFANTQKSINGQNQLNKISTETNELKNKNKSIQKNSKNFVKDVKETDFSVSNKPKIAPPKKVGIVYPPSLRPLSTQKYNFISTTKTYNTAPIVSKKKKKYKYKNQPIYTSIQNQNPTPSLNSIQKHNSSAIANSILNSSGSTIQTASTAQIPQKRGIDSNFNNKKYSYMKHQKASSLYGNTNQRAENPKTYQESFITPNWVDTNNQNGVKIYIDTNNQYYYSWGQVYTIKYIKNNKPKYVQILLSDFKGSQAAILSIDDTYKKTYEIQDEDFEYVDPEQSIYNSTKMALANRNKGACPTSICIDNDSENDINHAQTKSISNTVSSQTQGNPDFAPYMKNLQSKIRMHWHPPASAVSKEIIVLFKLARDGRVLSCYIVKTSGIEEADEAAINAIKEASPFGNLPSKFQGEYIDIQFKFNYNVYQGFRIQ